ncbi:MAG: M48 family metallopeptidase [Hydrogenobaculum sp.]|jgi:Predicted metal-dependent hydrolase
MSDNEFKQRVLAWAKIINVEPKEIHIRKMTKKWASCSSSGRLSFSKDLLDQALEFIDYVIVHELLHLRYPTHNKMFKLMLDIYLKESGKLFE